MICIFQILKEEKIEFLPDFKLVFYAHMISLAKRLKEDIALDCGDDCPEDEVEREAIEVSEKIIIPLAEKYKRDLNRMEIVLATGNGNAKRELINDIIYFRR